MSRRQKAKARAEIEAACERAERKTPALGKITVWTDARWYEVLSQDEIQAVFTERGYGLLRPTMQRMSDALHREHIASLASSSGTETP